MRGWLVDLFWMLLLAMCVPVAAGAELNVVRLEVDGGSAYGSGVVLAGQKIATVRHVVRGAAKVTVQIGGKEYSLRPSAITAKHDGAAILEGDLPVMPGVEIAGGPPQVGAELVMHGYGSRGRLESYAGTVLGGVSAGRGASTYLGNVVDAKRVVSGDSGGPAIDANGDVAGLVMLGSEEDVVLCSWADLSETASRAGLQTSGRRPDRNVITFYTSPMCGACNDVKRDIDLGVYRGTVFDVVDVTRMRGRVPVESTPAFSYGIHRYEPQAYNSGQLKKWLQMVLSSAGSSGEYLPTDPVASSPAAKPAIESIDWTGVRFGVLVSHSSPDFMARLRAPVQRALDIASGNQVPVEVFREGQSSRFGGIRSALGVNHSFAVYPFMTLDKVADVGLVKGLVLKKLEAAFDGRLNGETNELMPDLIFRRTSANDWQRVTQAMGEHSIRSGVPPPEAGVRVGSQQTNHQRSWAESIVAFVVGVLGMMKTVRSVRGFYSQQAEKLLEENQPADFFDDGKAGVE
ncbi:MAG: serine protease [Fuerstiella sp.]